MIKEINTKKDIREITGLIRESFQTVADEFNLNIENAPTHPAFIKEEKILDEINTGTMFYGYYKENRLIGSVAIKKKDEVSYYLERLAVKSEFRHKGIGKRLVDYCVKFVKENQGRELLIGIISENKVLKNWYKEYGFQEKETKKFVQLPFLVCFMEYEVK